jgi:nuclear pore complex protein Nup107
MFPLTRASSWPTIGFSLSFPLFSNVRHALLLANVVADSRYMLFTEFAGENGRRLREYLSAVRTAVLAGLEHGGSDPFRAVL